MDRSTTPSNVLDLCAYRAAHRPREAEEVAGRIEHDRLVKEARASVAAVGALKSRDVESVAVALHRVMREDVDDVTFAVLVDAMV
jgi:hypothetical protein